MRLEAFEVITSTYLLQSLRLWIAIGLPRTLNHL